MNQKLAARLLRAFTFVACISSAEAVVVHESASLGSPTGGFSANWEQYLGSRFSLTQSYQITSIGAFVEANSFCIACNNDLIFAALIKLDSANALPSFQVSALGSNVLAFSTFAPPSPGGEFLAPVSVELGPGSYALLIGSGLFGAFGNSYMPIVGADFPGSSYFYANVVTNTWVNGSFNDVRFVVEGDIAPVPSPIVGAGLPGLLLGFAGVGYMAYRRKLIASMP